MKGDVIVLEEHHKKVATIIVAKVIEKIKNCSSRYIITVAGESGSSKSETAIAIKNELENSKITSIVLEQDDYFHLPPKLNDAKRREDPEWLGPHVEVNLDQLENNLKNAKDGASDITKPLIDYDKNIVEKEKISLNGIKVLLAVGTYTSLLKNVNTRVFIAMHRLATLAHHQKRNRSGETDDPFVENTLITEHLIIAGHMQLADFVITKNYDVIVC